MATSIFEKIKKKISGEKMKVPESQVLDVRDFVAPPSLRLNGDHIQLGERYAKTFFIFSYPRYLTTGWFSPIINLDVPMDISFFIHPTDTSETLKELRKRITATKAEMMERREQGRIRSPQLEFAYQNMEQLRDRLQTGTDKMFSFGLYLTIYSDELDKMREIETTLRSILESRLVYIKPATWQQGDGFLSTSPYGLDKLLVHTPMNTAPLSSVFPFISFDLSSNKGILYGINQHNNSLILFDRFSLESYNQVFFGTSGCGKSFLAKLEILRSMMTGVDVIVVDPENEYEFLADATGGSFLNISLTSPHHMNPFDLPTPREDENPENVLRSNIINLVGLMRIMLGGLSPEEDAIIDQALTATYAARDITPESDPSTWQENTPLLSDLESVLETMEGAESLVRRLRKYTKGTYSEFFNQPSNLDLGNNLVVFGIRDMEEELKQLAMFIIMRYIWNQIRTELKKRILVIDEAWWMMRTEDGASFLYGLVKRARKYWLGVTTITQDVSDFMRSEYGKPIVANSALQILMKQSPSAIDVVQKTFNLTEEEKMRLLEASVGETLFFAGNKHVAMSVVASYTENQIITSSPEEVAKIKRSKKSLKKNL